MVVLRGLTLNGSLGGVNGITFTGGSAASNTRLYVENCVISGFSGEGVNFARNGALFISDLVAREDGHAIFVDGSPGLPSSASIDHALLERDVYDGLRINNATVAIRNSVAAGNAYVGFYARANDSGTTADLSAENCQATGNQQGFAAGGGSGTARLAMSNSVAHSNSQYGVIVGSNGTVRASNNTVTGNGFGLYQFASGVFRSRGNNTVDGNLTAETFGTITTFGPM